MVFVFGANVNGVAIMENRMEDPQNIKNRTTMYVIQNSPGITGYLPKKNESANLKRMCTVASFTVADLSIPRELHG